MSINNRNFDIILCIPPPLPLLTITISLLSEQFLLAVTSHWGFNLDSPYDMESRYDSLIRDLICCFLGMLLAWETTRLVKSPSWCSYPMSLDLSLPSSNKHSIKRFAKVFVSLAMMWQIFLLYNADGGVKKFARNNLLVCILVLGWWVACYVMNAGDFPEVPRRKLITWHASGAVVTVLGTAMSIYPLVSTIYLIMIFEGCSKLGLLVFDAVLTENLGGVKEFCGLNDDESKDAKVEEVLSKCRGQIGAVLNKRPDLREAIKAELATVQAEPASAVKVSASETKPQTTSAIVSRTL